MKVERHGMALVFRFPEIGKVLELDTRGLKPDIVEQAMFHGLKQKCVDAAALSRDPATGRSATAEEKWAAVTAMIDRLEGGEWNSRGEGGSVLLDALCQAFPNKSREELQRVLDGLSEKEKRAMRDSDRLKPFLPKRDGKKGDELLEGLLGDGGS